MFRQFIKVTNYYFFMQFSYISEINNENPLSWHIEMQEELKNIDQYDIAKLSEKYENLSDNSQKNSFLTTIFMYFSYYHKYQENYAELLSTISWIDFIQYVKRIPPQLLFYLYAKGKVNLNYIKREAEYNDNIKFVFSSVLKTPRTAWFYSEKQELSDNEFEDIIKYGYKRDSIEFSLKYDKIDELIKYSESTTFNVNQKCIMNPFDDVFVGDPNFTLIKFAAAFGSIECFKFLLMNKAAIDENLAKFAVIGGNLEIIRICYQNKINLRNCHAIAIQYHQNNVFDWLQENINNQNENLIHFAAKSNNMQALVYYVQNNVDLNPHDENGCAPLHYLAFDNSFAAFKYLVDNGADLSNKTNLGDSVQNIAQMNQSYYILSEYFKV